MTIFDKIFGKKRVDGTTEEKKDVPSIARDLFIEEQQPLEVLQGLKGDSTEEQEPVLDELLGQDYFAMGQKDGYEDHRPEVMDEQLDLIASIFREAYYREKAATIERIDRYQLELSPKTQEVMPDQFARIDKKVEQEQRRLEDLQVQIDLAGCGQGYIEQSVRLYKAGFRKGYTLWLDEEIVFRERKLL